MLRDTCIHCDHELVPYAHWGICPVCSADFLAAVRPPSIAHQIQAQVGGLLDDRGRPTRNGVTE